MRKPNYRFNRAERDRLKQAKKEEKLKRRAALARPETEPDIASAEIAPEEQTE